MRIQLLIQREPFFDILKNTLESYWSQKYDKPIRIEWIKKGNLTKGNNQIWYCNHWINAIFTKNPDPELFDPLRKEFSRSTKFWKRFAQSLFVDLSTSNRWAHLIAQSKFHVQPAIEDNDQSMIVPGNNKIRILDSTKNTSTSIVKHGFSSDYLKNELSARQQAEKLSLPVPKILEQNLEQGWFKEEYISGKPLNRLSDQELAWNTFLLAYDKLSVLHNDTAQQQGFSEYGNQLTNQIDRLVRENQLLSHDQKNSLVQITQKINSKFDPLFWQGENQLITVQSHGDFQPANILLEDETLWIIDWEYTHRRQYLYDLLTYVLSARSSIGVSNRLLSFVSSGIHFPGSSQLKTIWDINNASDKRRFQIISLFAFEELHMHIQENSNQLFHSISGGLPILLEELSIWTSSFK